MYYYTSQRIDLYMNDKFINATNAVYSTGSMTIKDPAGNLSAYMPTIQSPVGTNLFYKGDNKMHFVLDGSSYIDLKIAPVLFVRFGFPAVTPEQFFSPATVVGNIALLLGVPASSIRQVKVIRATSKKRQTSGTISIEITIMSNPITSLNNTNAANAVQSQLSNLSTTISNQFSTGQLQKNAQTLLNVTLSSCGIIPPITTPQNTSQSTVITIQKIASISVIRNADQCNAMMPCYVQPILAVLDTDVKSNLSLFNLIGKL